MRIFCAAALTILLSLWLSCSPPGNTTLRIGITESAGATILYIAEELDQYRAHGVNARVVELADCEALEHAFKEKQLDAIVMPHRMAVKMINDRRSDAGVLLVVAIARNPDIEAHWQSTEEEVLLVRRAEVMHRRAEWSNLLEAYEHARLRVRTQPDSVAAVLALREHRSSVDIAREITYWNFFGLSEQDSLLDVRGALSDLDARWQGNLQFAGGAARNRGNQPVAVKEPEQHNSR